MPRGKQYDGNLDESELLSRLDREIRAELQRRLLDKSVTRQHVAELYRMVSSIPEERDAEAIEALLDGAAGMDADELRQWVDDRIVESRDR